MSVLGTDRPIGRITVHRIYEEMDQRARDIKRGEPQALELDALEFWLPWLEELVLAELGDHPMGISGLFDDDDTATYPGRPWTPEDGLWDGTECETLKDIVVDTDTGVAFEVTIGAQ